ncbi:uncharacterized protein [Halyomorpha halys]|uniref:uncharacterized protein n=1 Tax=Halyomorpha halys TaxID=286706 RepID=UPI0006D4CAD3|nr:uncharacterized protein LOC106683296 [Halyomorpha halys]
MYKFFCLVLLSALAAAGAKRVNINDGLDSITEYLNDRQRSLGTTSAPFPEIPLGSRVKYSGGSFLGIDSFKRTGDCWQEINGNDMTFDINYGFGLLTIVLPHLEIAGTNMSAYARIRDNSVHLSYTLHHGADKCITLNDFKVEKLGNVEFGASRPEYDGSNLDGFFKLVAKPSLDGLLDSLYPKIESSLQKLCKVRNFQNQVEVLDLVKSLLYIFFHSQEE